MKYMGSKRAMLQNGLGMLLRQEGEKSDRIIDLFCGSASVAWFASQHLDRPVYAFDLQEYSVVLAQAIIGRIQPISSMKLTGNWLGNAIVHRYRCDAWLSAIKLDHLGRNTRQWSKGARSLCEENRDVSGPIWKAYGGYYFSPTQALAFDAMLSALPTDAIARSVCLAATIVAASQCVASPGHTAQPFSASKGSGQYLREAWMRDPMQYARSALEEFCPRHANAKGKAECGDANKIAPKLHSSDLVFIDPPYSGVHYSRFYHVLETIARGKCSEVSGAGRYPKPEERPVSAYSRQSESQLAIKTLFGSLAKVGCKALVTFPSGECSNGLSGEFVVNEAKKLFKLEQKIVKTRFSTLGGNNVHRKARQNTDEMILLLRPR